MGEAHPKALGLMGDHDDINGNMQPTGEVEAIHSRWRDLNGQISQYYDKIRKRSINGTAFNHGTEIAG